MNTDNRILDSKELEAVSGGMKWNRGTANGDVIDARGGSFTVCGVRFTFNAAGHLSSVG